MAYINRDLLLKDIEESVVFTVRGQNSLEIRGANKITDRIKNAPTADVVEVVRCRDCVNSRPLCDTEKKLYCENCVGCTQLSTSYHSVIMFEDSFCSYGKRKEVEE